jgi:uncharacterized protein
MKVFIQKLEEGIHEIEHKISSQTYEFLDAESYPQSLLLNLYIDRINDLFRFKITIKTRAIYTCDRCLVRFKTDFDETIEQLYQIGNSDFEDEDEIEVLPENTKEIDISKAIQEAFIMNRPIKLLCSEECKGLCLTCGINLNKKQCKCSETMINPRLEKLKIFMK